MKASVCKTLVFLHFNCLPPFSSSHSYLIYLPDLTGNPSRTILLLHFISSFFFSLPDPSSPSSPLPPTLPPYSVPSLSSSLSLFFSRIVLIVGSESVVSLTQTLIWELIAQNSRTVEAVRLRQQTRHAVLYYAVLHCTVLSYALICNNMPYYIYTVPHCALLCFAILCYAVVYYAILQDVALYRLSLPPYPAL